MAINVNQKLEIKEHFKESRRSERENRDKDNMKIFWNYIMNKEP